MNCESCNVPLAAGEGRRVWADGDRLVVCPDCAADLARPRDKDREP
jgi:hypothetical protein